jgi:hypothetical protein
MIGMCNAATAWYGIEPDASLERIAGGFARLLLSGLARTGSAAAARSRR